MVELGELTLEKDKSERGRRTPYNPPVVYASLFLKKMEIVGASDLHGPAA